MGGCGWLLAKWPHHHHSGVDLRIYRRRRFTTYERKLTKTEIAYSNNKCVYFTKYSNYRRYCSYIWLNWWIISDKLKTAPYEMYDHKYRWRFVATFVDFTAHREKPAFLSGEDVPKPYICFEWQFTMYRVFIISSCFSFIVRTVSHGAREEY